MKQIDKLNRRLLCRDGPKLEMSSSIRIDHCVERIEMDTCLNSIARFFGNASAVTVARVTDATLENFSANVRNGCSMASTSHQTVPSQHRMLCRKLYDQQRPTSVTAIQADHRGRNATIDTLTIVVYGCGQTPSLKLCHGWVSRNESSKLNHATLIVRRAC